MANNCSCEKAVLKQGINMLMPVEFEGLDLDTVESIDFILKQWNTTWEFSYPSEIASRRSGSTNIVDIVWRESNTSGSNPLAEQRILRRSETRPLTYRGMCSPVRCML